MWFSFFRIFGSQQENTFFAGGASCSRNAFWSQNIPGIQTCKTRNLSDLFLTYNERKQVLLVDDGSNTSVHCSQQYNSKEINYLKDLAKEKNVYFTVYFNKSKHNAPLFYNETYMYTNFKIFFD